MRGEKGGSLIAFLMWEREMSKNFFSKGTFPSLLMNVRSYPRGKNRFHPSFDFQSRDAVKKGISSVPLY